MSDVTRILDRVQQGDPSAADELLPLVYEELRKLAAAKMAREAPGQTLQVTALVHEAWLRLGGEEQCAWQNRAHFLKAAAEAMRRILVERDRRKLRLKRGGLSFADGHSELRRWKDARTMPPIVKGGNPFPDAVRQPGNRDIIWLQERATRKM
jgi:RNA polymerase sigma factor (TIGR02999 family)